uniref:Uncharacterized protein n=1 Tax=Timema poppense TaxID=170557 RepID=A0A7R9CNW1_TIMPO|nr:unnamed protein product [Timema poppensis]
MKKLDGVEGFVADNHQPMHSLCTDYNILTSSTARITFNPSPSTQLNILVYPKLPDPTTNSNKHQAKGSNSCNKSRCRSQLWWPRDLTRYSSVGLDCRRQGYPSLIPVGSTEVKHSNQHHESNAWLVAFISMVTKTLMRAQAGCIGILRNYLDRSTLGHVITNAIIKGMSSVEQVRRNLAPHLCHRQRWNRSKVNLFLVSLSQAALEQVQRNLAPRLYPRLRCNRSRATLFLYVPDIFWSGHTVERKGLLCVLVTTLRSDDQHNEENKGVINEENVDEITLPTPSVPVQDLVELSDQEEQDPAEDQWHVWLLRVERKFGVEPLANQYIAFAFFIVKLEGKRPVMLYPSPPLLCTQSLAKHSPPLLRGHSVTSRALPNHLSGGDKRSRQIAGWHHCPPITTLPIRFTAVTRRTTLPIRFTAVTRRTTLPIRFTANALRVALEKVSDQMKNKTLANEDHMLMDIMTIQNENEDVPELSLLELQQDEMWDDRTSLASGEDFTFQLPTIYRDMEGWIAEDLMFPESANGDLSLPPVGGAPDIQLMELQTQIKELADEQESAAVSVQQLLDYMASMAPGDKVRQLLDPK